MTRADFAALVASDLAGIARDLDAGLLSPEQAAELRALYREIERDAGAEEDGAGAP